MRMRFRRVDIPILITVRDRLEPLQQLVDWLERAGGNRVILVDNDSQYPPMLDYLASTPHEVVRTGRNLGPRAAWILGLVHRVGLRTPYVVTDPDVVPDPDCPLDALDHFADLLDRHRGVGRVGFGLRIDDLPPSNPRSADVVAWESQFWQNPVEPGVYAADIDTTFALYRPGVPVHLLGALRTGEPYLARHLAWYDDPAAPSDEERFYRERADPSINSWNREDLPPYLRRLIDQRTA